MNALTLTQRLAIIGQYVLPQHGLSRLVGKLAAVEAGDLTQWLIKNFIKRYGVDMSEAVESDPAAYKTFNDFFTRAIKAELRPVVDDASQLAQPVDGSISQLGDITQGRIFQAKGHDFGLVELLGGDPAAAMPFQAGNFATVYLSPKDYHRIHMPLDGTLTEMRFVPGKLFSVNPLTAENVPGLFARNERVVCFFDSSKGKFALVLVGATIVASVATVWGGVVAPNAPQQVQHWRYATTGDDAIHLQKGAEMGRFLLGSTIVLVTEPGLWQPPNVASGTVTRMGEAFGKLLR